MRRCVIVGGAPIGDYEAVRGYFREDDIFICCDSGLRHLEGLKISPDLIIGDFDSHEDPRLPVETITLPCEKDDTDTVFAVKTGAERGFKEFLLAGVIGARLDHTLANTAALLWLQERGLRAMAVDDYSELEVLGREPVRIPDRFAFFSLLSIFGKAEGIRVRNAKYPLEDAVIHPDYQYGVSNEVLPGKTAEVSVKDGKLLLIRDRR